ncbi:hypothetical protein LINGRAPRIM_LOCUS2352 [Linum grandiflorum]
MPGRPKKVRRKDAHELEMIPTTNGGTVLSRRGILMHCSKCSGSSHNARHCTKINDVKDVHLPSLVRRRARGRSPEMDSGFCCKERNEGNEGKGKKEIKGNKGCYGIRKTTSIECSSTILLSSGDLHHRHASVQALFGCDLPSLKKWTSWSLNYNEGNLSELETGGDRGKGKRFQDRDQSCERTEMLICSGGDGT